MFEAERKKLIEYRKMRTFINIVGVTIKLLIAYALIIFVDFGIFIVVGYILYALENAAGLQLINSKETDLQLNIINQRLDELQEKTNH